MDAKLWLDPLIGGIFIGLASSVMLAFNGRIAGISGIIGQSLTKINPMNYWRYAFLGGLVFGGAMLNAFRPEFFEFQIHLGWAEAIIGGLLVGYGTQMGSGCTSGHGVCGLPRFSTRSMLATALFMTSAIVFVGVRTIFFS
ncbi:MAG: YeeE/YedE family protein [Bdellovibrionales bacterium]